MVPRTYINCIGEKARGGPRTAQAEGIDDYHELSTGHDAMITVPEEVAELLLKVAQIRSSDSTLASLVVPGTVLVLLSGTAIATAVAI
jgi:hypothetical protein